MSTKALAALVKALTPERAVPSFMAKAMLSALAKGKNHKYLRRVPIPGKLTKTGKQRYRYFYRTIGGKGLGHHDEMQVGAAFKMKDGGSHGHFEVTHDHGDGHLTVRHDETGTEHKIHRDTLATMLHREHAEVRKEDDAKAAAKREKAKAQALKDMEEAKKHGASEKTIAAAKKRAAAAGHVEEKAKTQPIHVPMTTRESETIARERNFERDMDEAHERINTDIQGSRDRAAVSEGLRTAVNQMRYASSPSEAQAIAERARTAIFSSRAFKAIPREERPPLVAATSNIIEFARSAAVRFKSGTETNAAFRARQAHRERIIDRVKEVVGPETAGFLNRHQDILGMVALGQIKDTADLAKHINDAAKAQAKQAHAAAEAMEPLHKQLKGHNPNPFSNPDHASIPGTVRDAAETVRRQAGVAAELEALGHDMAGHEDLKGASDKAASAHKTLMDKNERFRAEEQERKQKAEAKEAEAKRAAEAERLKSRPTSVSDATVNKVKSAIEAAKALPDKPVSAHKDHTPQEADIKRLSTFTGKDPTRPNLAGVHADGKFAYATDGHRAVIVPTTTKAPRESFPDVNRIVPNADFAASVHSFDTKSLQALVDAAKEHHKANKVAKSIPPQILFTHTEDGGLHASLRTHPEHEAQAPDLKVHAKTHKAAQDGGDWKAGDAKAQIAVNAKYLQDALAGHKGPVTLRVSHGGQYGPLDFHRTDGERHIIMPMRI